MTYDYVCFTSLVNELMDNDASGAKRRISSRLRYFGLAKYNQERIELIRNMKDNLRAELSNPRSSSCYAGSNTKFAEPSNFNFECLVRKYSEKFPSIERDDLGRMINFAIYSYYLR